MIIHRNNCECTICRSMTQQDESKRQRDNRRNNLERLRQAMHADLEEQISTFERQQLNSENVSIDVLRTWLESTAKLMSMAKAVDVLIFREIGKDR